MFFTIIIIFITNDFFIITYYTTIPIWNAIQNKISIVIMVPASSKDLIVLLLFVE